MLRTRAAAVSSCLDRHRQLLKNTIRSVQRVVFAPLMVRRVGIRDCENSRLRDLLTEVDPLYRLQAVWQPG